MLRGIVYCPDGELGVGLEQALRESKVAGVLRECHYPTPAELDRVLKEYAPQVFFLSLESAHGFLAAANAIEEKAPGVPIVGVTRSTDAAALETMLQGGARGCLSPPFGHQQVRQALAHVVKLWERNTLSTRASDRVFAFLPSKPGVGASTVALNLSLAFARVPETSVLLADFDLNSGMIAFMLRLQRQYSVVEAVQHAYELDEQLWNRLVACTSKLDVLPSGQLNPGLRIDPEYLHPLVSFARHNYDVICLDLSGMMERFSMELLRESGQIFLVCTTEIPSLHLAAQKMKYLRGAELADRVQVLVNRVQKHSVMSQQEIESMIGAPVMAAIPNEYARVHESLMAGQGVDPASRLGSRLDDLARTLLGAAPAPGRKKRRLLDYLSLGSSFQPEPASNRTAG